MDVGLCASHRAGAGEKTRPKRAEAPAKLATEFPSHDEAVAKLQREHRRLQDRIHAVYMDKLDGRIDNDLL